MKTSIFLVLAGCVALVASQLAGFGAGQIVSKLTASSAFLAVATNAGALDSRYGRILLSGLALSWLGDACLLGSTGQLFLFGLISFALAHVVYIAAFAVRGMNSRWVALAFVPIATISLGVSVWLTPFVSSEMLIAVWIYTLVISLMVIAAFGVKGAGGPVLIPLGALLFYASDLSVAAGQYVQPEFPNYVWGLPFYYAGQLLLALSTRSETRRTPQPGSNSLSSV